MALQDGRVQGTPEAVAAEDVEAAGAHRGRHPGHGVQEPLDAGPDPAWAAWPPRAGGGVGGAGQVEQQELANLVADLHALEATSCWSAVGGAGSTWINRHSHPVAITGLVELQSQQ